MFGNDIFPRFVISRGSSVFTQLFNFCFLAVDQLSLCKQPMNENINQIKVLEPISNNQNIKATGNHLNIVIASNGKFQKPHHSSLFFYYKKAGCRLTEQSDISSNATQKYVRR